MTVRDRVVMITGGRRIGQVVARELAALGADLVLSYRGSKGSAEDTAEEVRRRGRAATVVQADVTKASDCAALMKAADSAHGRLDVLINMASVYASTTFEHLTEAEW